MKIKRYTGTHTREVLTRIRNDLGADAVILSNREIVGGVELMAAVDFDASRFPSEESGEAAAPVALAVPSPVQPSAKTADVAVTAPPASAAVQQHPHPNPPHAWGGGEPSPSPTRGGGREGHPKEAQSAVFTSPTRGGGWEWERAGLVAHRRLRALGARRVPRQLGAPQRQA